MQSLFPEFYGTYMPMYIENRVPLNSMKIQFWGIHTRFMAKPKHNIVAHKM